MLELNTTARNTIIHKIIQFENNRNMKHRGRPIKNSFATILERIFYVCRTGCQWSQLHVYNSSYQTVYHHFNRWSKAIVFEDSFCECVISKTSPGKH